MNVYDFDKTIYNGDSTIDFYIYCLIRKPYLIIYFPKQVLGYIKYILKKQDKTKFKEDFYCFLNGLKDVDLTVKNFWGRNSKKIKEWYIKQKKANDVIISASPSFLLREICRRLHITNLICSDVDYNGHYTNKNCYGEEKVRRFLTQFPNRKIDEFYSDSLSDLPLALLSKKSFLVHHNTIKSWPFNH